jgi:hypothetical protein
MSIDSMEQYRQARMSIFSDGHPPVMAWVWSKLNLIVAGPQNMLFFHLAMLWSGLYFWQKNEGESLSAKWFVVLGFVPWVANFEGVLWKDMGMAYSLLLGLSLLSQDKLKKLHIIVAIILLMYAFMVRGNAPAALIPISWYALVRVFPASSDLLRIVATAIVLLLMFAFQNLFNYSLLNAQKDNMVSFVMTDDLVHLSTITNKSLLPGVPIKTVTECSNDVIGGTKLTGRLFCLINKPTYQQVTPIPYDQLKQAWFHAISESPFEYIKFRLGAYLYLLRDPGKPPYIHAFFGTLSEHTRLHQEDNLATKLLKKYIYLSKNTLPFLFKPYWWLIIGLLFLVATWRMHGDKNALQLIRVLLVSALLYMFSYIPLTPMADLRYVFWGSLAISLAAVKYAASTLTFRLNRHAV